VGWPEDMPLISCSEGMGRSCRRRFGNRPGIASIGGGEIISTVHIICTRSNPLGGGTDPESDQEMRKETDRQADDRALDASVRLSLSLLSI
jgi:hypothetical protein